MRYAALALLFLLAGCAKDNDEKTEPVQATDPSPLSDATSYGNIAFDGALSRKERGAFVTAMDYLDRPGVWASSNSLASLLHIKGDNASVHHWLDERVQYILADSSDANRVKRVSLGNFQYPLPGVQGSPDGASARGSDSVHVDGPKTIMLNIGAAMYASGKEGGYLWQLDADGLGRLSITSPRTGILLIGDGLFMLPADQPNIVKIFHLGTLLHEARHSDGNGKTEGFFHSNCTSDDPGMAHYKGKAACDHSTNGPYTVGALATYALRETCTDCSVEEREELYEIYLDYKSRVIFDNATSAWDDKPEGHR